jgi:hypothetical protein
MKCWFLVGGWQQLAGLLLLAAENSLNLFSQNPVGHKKVA